VIRAERVLESRVGGARVHEVRVAELPDVSQPLERCAVDDAERARVDPDVVPERVPHDLEVAGERHGVGYASRGPAARTAGAT
jgi:hypothetical protein